MQVGIKNALFNLAIMSKLRLWIKELKEIASEVKKDLQIYLFLRRYIARNSLRN